ncbi:thioredoxin family protein [Schinkia sp. CFF1]
MKKKRPILFTVGLLTIIVLSMFAINMLNKTAAEGNPYKKETLHPATIAQLDDSNYKNIILPDELEKILQNDGTAYIYFYSPTCSHCKVTSPVVVPMAKEKGVNLQLYNLLEFKDGWETYKITGTPTIVYFENGKEATRIEGGVEKEQFEQWFDETKKEVGKDD